jgi:(p)ppGpp synthase/HD superfamily hydrolase
MAGTPQMKGAIMLTSRFDEAFAYARLLHNKQTRKQSQTPYISHLMSVSSLVLEHSGDEDQAIAALLHDAAEDCGGTETLEIIRTRFGEAVAQIVADCTDSYDQIKSPWKPRKLAYISKLPHKPKSSLLVSLADKTHNAECIYSDWLVLGDLVYDRFSVERDETLWYYREMSNIFQAGHPGPLANRLERAVIALKA